MGAFGSTLKLYGQRCLGEEQDFACVPWTDDQKALVVLVPVGLIFGSSAVALLWCGAVISLWGFLFSVGRFYGWFSVC